MYFVSDRDNVLLEFVDADGIEGIEEPTFQQRYLHGPAVDLVVTPSGFATIIRRVVR